LVVFRTLLAETPCIVVVYITYNAASVIVASARAFVMVAEGATPAWFAFRMPARAFAYVPTSARSRICGKSRQKQHY
ncbi:MAG: hypothetical protein WCU80_11395, partial [Paludibacteraceae bacterium]